MKKSKSLSLLKYFKKQLIAGPIFKSFEVIFELIIPFIVSDVINIGIVNNDVFFIITRCLLIISLGILGLTSTLVCQYFASIASQGYGTLLRDKIFEHSNNLSLRQINSFSKGYIQTLITNDSIYMQNAVAVGIRLLIRAPFLVLGAMICSFIINYIVGFIFLGLTIIISIILYFIISYASKRYLIIQKQLDHLSNNVSDNLKGSRVIRAFNYQDEEVVKFKKESNDYKKKVLSVEKFNSFINPLTFGIINVGIVLILYFTSFYPGFFNLNGGEIVALINYLNQILVALLVVSNLVVIFNKAFASKKRLDDFLNEQNEIKSGNLNKIDEHSLNCLEFNNVSFSFNDGKKNVLNNLNFKLEKGKSLGIIGTTGSGKTSIVNLILRLYNASNGKINFFGNNLNDYNIDYLKELISYSPQKSLLYKGTIKSNMLIAKKDASDEEIINALKLANAYEFVMKYDDGINHEVEENGTNFSGGQKQRLSLARSLLKDSKLLIIDDSFSALDYLSEKTIRKNIEQLQINCNLSTIIISQRISSLKDLDAIIVIDNGEIQAIGNNDELLKISPLYKQIYDIQTKDI